MFTTISFDMDGVLVDLSRNLARLDGYEDPVLWYMHKVEDHGQMMYMKSIQDHIYANKCFETCSPMPYYESMQSLMVTLHNKGYKINILSSCMDQPYSDEIKKQKILWLQKYYGFEMQFFNKIDIVRGSKHKIDYVDDNTILIDDYVKTKNTFIENGKGDQFIQYTNYNDCINQLIEKNII